MYKNINKLYYSVLNTVSKNVKIIEVGPRDGLQNEKKVLSLETRKDLINKCSDIGLKHIEIGSYINNKLLPQVGNTDKLLKILSNTETNFYSVLVPHKKFWVDRENIKEIVLFVAASKTFNKKNINCDIDEAFNRFKDISEIAKEKGIKLRGSISTCFGCPYEGEVEVKSVIEIVKKYEELGCELIDIADTIGIAKPEQVYSLLNEVKHVVDINKLTGHYHDNNDTAILNVEASLKAGMRIFHSSIGGLGGCPFSSKRVGNLSTEKLVEYLDKHNYTCGVNKNKVDEVGVWIKEQLEQ
jgi:hydroxymethylglutaryl-CoA lyase